MSNNKNNNKGVNPAAKKINNAVREAEKNPTPENKAKVAEVLKTVQKETIPENSDATQAIISNVNGETSANVADNAPQDGVTEPVVISEGESGVLKLAEQGIDAIAVGNGTGNSAEETTETETTIPELNYAMFSPANKEDGFKMAISKGWKVIFLLELLGLTEEDTFVAYEDTTMMPTNLANAINRITEASPDSIIKFVVPAGAVAAVTKSHKTQGIYEITSVFNPAFSLKGSSSQIEICTRDYMSWCIKNKAPKTMQAEYDRAKKENKEADPKKIFKVAVLKAADDLKVAKEEFGLANKGGKPQGTTTTAPVTPEEALKAMPTLEETTKATAQA